MIYVAPKNVSAAMKALKKNSFNVIDKLEDRDGKSTILIVIESTPSRSNPPKLGRAAQKRISKKIAKLRREGYSAKQAAAIAYKYERSGKLGPRGGKKNPIEDKDLAECIEALAILSYLPHYTESFDEHILDVLESEGLWAYESGVTDKGKEFLGSVALDHTDF
jgi:hypothetical protein